MNPEKLAKLQAKAAEVRIGGKGSARRKKKFVHRSAADDKKVQKEAAKAEPDVKPGPSQPKKEEPKITELKLTEAFIEKCNVSTSTVPIDVKVETAENEEKFKTAENEEKFGGMSIEELKLRSIEYRYVKSYTIIVKEGVQLGEGEGLSGMIPQGTAGFRRWNGSIYYHFKSLKHLEAVLNSRTDYLKGHKLRALCTVFFTRVNKDLLVNIKNETENMILCKKAEQDSGVVIDDIRHIGLGRTIRVHCRTPTGADTIVKNGLLIGGITLRKGKIEDLNPVVQCTHCWQVGHKIGKCELFTTNEPSICGTCGKTGHRRKECPTPKDPKCVLCDGKHSSSAARCPVRLAKIKECLKSNKEGKHGEGNPSHRLKKVKEIAEKLKESTNELF